MNIEQFWASVEKQADGCWIWKRALGGNGYGFVSYRGATHPAHRLAWIFTHGPIPLGRGYHGTIVAHKCDVRACVNPDHLFLTDASGNQIDCLHKGRASASKLTVQQVMEIVRMLREGAGAVEVAAKFDVTVPTVRAIVKGRTWSSVVAGEELKFAPREVDVAKLRTADYDKIRAMLGSGKTIRQIARDCGTTHTTVRRVIAQTKQQAATPFQRLNDVIRERICDLSRAGESQGAIADWLHISQASVSRVLASTKAA